jgi:hypothetical protein
MYARFPSALGPPFSRRRKPISNQADLSGEPAMSSQMQQYKITFHFRHCEAFAEVDLKAYDEAHAIRLAESTLNKDLGPQLHHIQLVG